jgi:hypothetical protein
LHGSLANGDDEHRTLDSDSIDRMWQGIQTLDQMAQRPMPHTSKLNKMQGSAADFPGEGRATQ